MSPKKVNIGGFEMVSGGDISLMDSDKESKHKEKGEEDQAKKEENREYKESDLKEDKKKKVVGKDLSSFNYTSMASVSDRRSKESKSVGRKIGSFFNKLKGFFSKGGIRQKLMISFGVVFVAFFFLSYFVLPKASVNINIESEDIELEEIVVANTEVSTLDMENLIIPAEIIEAMKDRSNSAGATGVTETGEVASGEVSLYNLTDSDVRISANTVLESIETGLKYTTVSEVTVPAKKPEDDPTSPGLIGTIDVGITAESFGANYNLAEKERFRVQGFDLENLFAKNFNSITGGTTEQRKVVSQEDYDTLKTSLEDQLKQDLVSSLEVEAGSSKELLTDTIEYEVVNEDASPGVDAEAETFNLSLTLKATALSFSSEDIDTLAEKLVEDENDQNVEVDEFDYSSEVLSSEGNKININLSITGVVTPSINEDEVRNNLVSKSDRAGSEYLDTFEKIKSYEVVLYPNWLPAFLKHYPSSPNRIELNVKKV